MGMRNRDEGAATADAVDAQLRRQAVWSRLLQVFKEHRPDEEALSLVSTLAEVSIDQVFGAYKLTPSQMVERHGAVKDFAECAALYGYVLGMHNGVEYALRQSMKEGARAVAGD